MKLYFTRDELEAEWQAKFPSDTDYKHNSVAGHVETEKGFIWYSYWEVEKRRQDEQGS